MNISSKKKNQYFHSLDTFEKFGSHTESHAFLQYFDSSLQGLKQTWMHCERWNTTDDLVCIMSYEWATSDQYNVPVWSWFWLVLTILLLLYHDFILLHPQLTFSVFLTDLRSDVSHPLIQQGDDGGWSEKLQDFNGNGSASGLLEPDSGPLGLYPSTPGRPQKDLPHNHRPQWLKREHIPAVGDKLLPELTEKHN